MFAAEAACPGCGRSAWRSAEKTASVPSRPSTLIAAAMSAVVSSVRRSSIARTSMPSMPSVPLMSARPSFSASVIGAIPASASASAADRSRPSASRTGPSPMTASAQCASGARSPEQPSDPCSWTIGVIPARQDGRVGLGRLAAHAGPPGGERRQAQEHQRAHDLALDLGPRSRRVAADQAALQLGAQRRRDVAAGERAEAGRDAVVRAGVLDERVDDGARALDLADRVLGERDRRAVARDGDDVLDGRRADADDDGLLCVHGRHSTGAARRCHRDAVRFLSDI